MCGACSTTGREKKCIQKYVRKAEAKGPLGRPRHIWKAIMKDVG
jgi:hypothetical protein